MQIFGLPGWSAVSAGGLKALNLPPDVRRVIIAADNDPSRRRPAQCGGGTSIAGKPKAARCASSYRPPGATISTMSCRREAMMKTERVEDYEVDPEDCAGSGITTPGAPARSPARNQTAPTAVCR